MALAFIPFETNLLLFPGLILLYLLFSVILKQKSSKVPPLPPGPKPWPVLGNVLSMRDKPHVALAQLAKVHGPLFSLRQGTQLVIVASSSAAATEILKTHDRELCGRPTPDAVFSKWNPAHDQLNRLAWTDLSEEWKSFRSIMRGNLFGSQNIDNQSSIREKKVGEMLEFIGSKQGEVVQIRDIAFVYVFNSMGNCYFSRDFATFGGEDTKRVYDIVREMIVLWTIPNLSDLYPILSFLDLQGLRKKTNECVEKIRQLWDSYIRERRASKIDGDLSKQADFLDVLIQSGFSDEQISYIFLELYAAVSDSSTLTIEWAMSELMKQPEKMKKVVMELEQAIPGKLVKELDLANLPYLNACVKETLRLHPPAPLLLPRKATETCQVMNYTIPKGAQVLVNIWTIARDPTIWEDPLSFKPERFMNSDLDYQGKNFEYLPFGGGRRICAGMPMATRQIQLALASLIHNFEWSLPNNMLPHEVDMNESFILTVLSKEHSLKLIPKKKETIKEIILDSN